MQHSAILSRPVHRMRRKAAHMKLRAGALLRAYPRETIGLGLLSLIAAAAVGGAAHSTTEARATEAPPAPPPLLVRQLAPEQALQVNQEIPLTHGPNPAAAPFVFTGDAAERKQALECLASA